MTTPRRLPRPRPRWRVVLYVAGVVALVLVVATHIPSPVAWSLGCRDVAIGIPFPSNSIDHPYGTVRTCRVLDSRTLLVAGVDGSVFLLLDTETGSVAVRVDYRDTGLGRQYR